ncbi:hypothetical protein [Streptosporangium sp. V21-05]|uniref:hypothetical protein n=1 Tax=Streptosporangium sp. V21-05 TaxID=3446115 RepID=UPI003F5351E3
MEIPYSPVEPGHIPNLAKIRNRVGLLKAFDDFLRTGLGIFHHAIPSGTRLLSTGHPRLHLVKVSYPSEQARTGFMVSPKLTSRKSRAEPPGDLDDAGALASPVLFGGRVHPGGVLRV